MNSRVFTAVSLVVLALALSACKKNVDESETPSEASPVDAPKETGGNERPHEILTDTQER